MINFKKWLENFDKVRVEVIQILNNAKERISQYSTLDKDAATDTDKIVREARGLLRLAVPNFDVSKLTEIANTCNHLYYLDINLKLIKKQIQNDIDSIINNL